jgi:hypothetical protein
LPIVLKGTKTQKKDKFLAKARFYKKILIL